MRFNLPQPGVSIIRAAPHALLGDAFASADDDFINGIVSQLVSVGGRGQDINERGLNFMLSVIKGIEPRDQLEAMLAAQMAAVHVASMTFAHRLAHVDNIAQQDSAERAFNKLTRTFTTQMEALNRYRTAPSRGSRYNMFRSPKAARRS